MDNRIKLLEEILGYRIQVVELDTGETTLDCFFQAEDGIRDLTVTGVQTCALPISSILRVADPGRLPVVVARRAAARQRGRLLTLRVIDVERPARLRIPTPKVTELRVVPRSEERRVEKECRSRRSPYH